MSCKQEFEENQQIHGKDAKHIIPFNKNLSPVFLQKLLVNTQLPKRIVPMVSMVPLEIKG